ncbi:uncharacterized protein LOC131889058 isoform X1 [Tigriopus californicus]|uniref:uncharacterized protein LOC131889058 isoform X1 n=1 Tax=Tigriopus californicus TaxID=6832 RepID=UPI0027DAAFDF|nr:uncharacterized protein LOC131889058 isoform X1 [Tigriopus californicus]
MRIHIKENSSSAPESSGRIQDFEDGDEVIQCFICNQPGLLQCSEFPEVHYCSNEHKGLHQRPSDEDEDEANHDGKVERQSKTFPFVIKYRKDVGRYMVAARDIEAGELIFREDPLAMGPNHHSKPSCLECMRKVDGSYLCPKCQFPMCEEMCSLGEDHSGNECEIFTGIADKILLSDYEQANPKYWNITVLRLLLNKLKDPRKYDIILRMEDHLSEHKKEDTWQLYQEHVVDFLRNTCGLASKFTEEEIFHVLGVIDVNSVKIHSSSQERSSANQNPGHALYPVTALISHGCISNSKTIILPDYTNECRATTFIYQGDEITKQYVSSLETTNMRRAKLRSGWYFDCKCPRCYDPTENESYMSATSCLRCKTGVILPSHPLDPKSSWTCDLCYFKTNGEAVDKLVDYFLDKIKATRIEAVDLWEELLEKASKMFHSNHYILTLIRVTMNTAYIELGDRMELEPDKIPMELFMRRKDLLDDVRKVMDLVEPGLTRRRGISLFEAATCHLQLGRLLHEADRFGLEDFIQLIEAESVSLQEALRCLEHHPEGTLEASIHYKCEAALYEAEYTKKRMKLKLEEMKHQAQKRIEEREAERHEAKLELAQSPIRSAKSEDAKPSGDFDYLDGLLGSAIPISSQSPSSIVDFVKNDERTSEPKEVLKQPKAQSQTKKSSKQKRRK